MTGAEIRKARERKGMKLRELARKTGLSPTYISTIERGFHPGSLETREKIGKALGVNAQHPICPMCKRRLP